MKKKSEVTDELRPEYDMKSLLKGARRGKYTDRCRTGTNRVSLEAEVARVFLNEEAVNDALKLVMKVKKVQDEAGRYSTKRYIRTPRCLT